MKSSHFIAERSDIAEKALDMDLDHEVQMARQQCYNSAKDAIRLHGLLKNVSEMEGLEGWISAKITKAAEYLSAAADALEYDEIEKTQDDVVPVPDVDPMAFEDKAEELYNELLDETTSSGAVAVVAKPLGAVKKRKAKESTEQERV